MKRVFSLITCVYFVCGLDARAALCPDKIRWKKFRTVEAVSNVIASCVPVSSERSVIENFITKHKLLYYEAVRGTITFSVRARSRSFWIEKRWAVTFNLNQGGKLVSTKVEAWLTGP